MSTALAAATELARREAYRRRIYRDKELPLLISLMSAIDSRTGKKFTFEHIAKPLEPGEVWIEGNTLRCQGWDGPSNRRGGAKTWRWQRYIVDRLLARRRTIDLKGRQIGDTWTSLAVDVAEALTMPGTASLLFRQREDEAVDNVRRWWTLYRSLPDWILSRVPAGSKIGPVTVAKPDRTDRPGRDGVSLRFCDGSFSDITPQTSAAASGHGSSVRRVLLDEAAHILLLLSIRAAIEPAAGEASIGMVSTANGRSNPETGEGNEFHRAWVDEGSGYHRLFLGYFLHPDRDQHWYDTAEEVQSLPLWKRQEQFPRDEHEAFALSDRSFFDPDALHAYVERVENPVYRFDIEPVGPVKARFAKHENGRIRVYREPDPDHLYAIGVDVATGRGVDYSAAYVVDLATMELAAEYHGRVEADLYARDLHYLGRWYGTRSGCEKDALLAVETTGGYGEAVLIPLRDGVSGRPPYRRLYQHVLSAQVTPQEQRRYGFPTNPKTRPLILNQMEQHLRERSLPFVTNDLLHEMTEFVHHDHGTSPRARDGSRDDRVMACAIGLEMFRLFGQHPEKEAARNRRRRRVERVASRPWQTV